MSGQVQPGFEPVRAAFEAAQANDEGGAQLAVYQHGSLVVDLWTGSDPISRKPFTPDSVTVLMSVTKGMVSTCVHLLRARGQLDVDAPVTRYWPEFADDGQLTVAHLLTHRSGRSDFDADEGIGMAELLDWDRCVGALAAMTPQWTPGAYFKYHSLTWGYLVGEVVRRVAGMSVGQFFAKEVAGPLGLDMWIGMPSTEDRRFVPEFARWSALTGEQIESQFAKQGLDVTDRLVRAVIGSMLAGGATVDGLNARLARSAEIPAANGIGNARSLAKMYAATIGTIDGVRLLEPDTIAAATRPMTDGLGPPPPLNLLPPSEPMRVGLGYELARKGNPMLGPTSFGHAGAGGRLGFADPDSGIAVGYVCTNLLWDHTKGPDDRWVPWTAALREIV
ncbi:MAG TPA: serine hydrolase domain-containing protein [Pseudonocardiaceae bacterium]|jgi:CubicO group peptidase (beta-lactamase class C family)|nr:serine hydrolase domain-containing protein [Pseudonocardiaceae bacterium]